MLIVTHRKWVLPFSQIPKACDRSIVKKTTFVLQPTILFNHLTSSLSLGRTFPRGFGFQKSTEYTNYKHQIHKCRKGKANLWEYVHYESFYLPNTSRWQVRKKRRCQTLKVQILYHMASEVKETSNVQSTKPDTINSEEHPFFFHVYQTQHKHVLDSLDWNKSIGLVWYVLWVEGNL